MLGGTELRDSAGSGLVGILGSGLLRYFLSIGIRRLGSFFLVVAICGEWEVVSGSFSAPFIYGFRLKDGGAMSALDIMLNKKSENLDFWNSSAWHRVKMLRRRERARETEGRDESTRRHAVDFPALNFYPISTRTLPTNHHSNHK